MLIAQHQNSGLQRIFGTLQTRNFLITPQNARALAVELESIAFCRCDPPGAHRHFLAQHLHRGAAGGLGVETVNRRRFRRKPETDQFADEMLFDMHGAVVRNLGAQFFVVPQGFHQGTRAPVNKALCELFVQRIRQGVLDFARLGLPMLRVGKPFRTIGHKCPGPDMGQTVG